jgi:hypothetical protein
MTRIAMTGLLLLLPLGLAVGCGDGGSDVPAGYKRVEIGGLRFVLPSDLPVDEQPDDGELFVASKPGKLVMQPRVVASAENSDSEFLNVVGNIREVNTFGVRKFDPVSDVAIDVPGSDGAHRLVHTYVTGDKGGPDVPTTTTTVVMHKGKRFFIFTIAIPDAKRDELDAGPIVRSLELT